MQKDIDKGFQTMYIKFPTVTKLQLQKQIPQGKRIKFSSIRQKIMMNTSAKIALVKQTEQFKIVNLPEKNQIINIRRMSFSSKPIVQEENNQQQPTSLRKKIFSVKKLNSFMPGKDNQEGFKFKNPFKVTKSLGKLNQNIQTKQQAENKLKQWTSLGQKKSKKLIFQSKLSFDFFSIYPQIMRLISLSWGIMIVTSEVPKFRRAKIDYSNNGLIIKQIVKKRPWWHIVQNQQIQSLKKNQKDIVINLLWTTNTLSKATMQNLASFHKNLLQQQATQQDMQKYVFQRNLYKILDQIPNIKKLFFTQYQQQPENLQQWIAELLARQSIRKLIPQQLTINNHLYNNFQMTNKKMLYKNMQLYYRSLNRNPFQKVPKNHHITCYNWQQVVKNIKGQQRLWIMKPGQFTNRGRGIMIFRSTKEAVGYIVSNPPKYQQKTFLIQQYITPFLYESRKFDIRCYMLGVQIGQSLRFYWYEQGYIRTASQKFTFKKASRNIHLTNDAVQKYAPNYDKHQSANKLSYNDMDKYCLNNTTFRFYQQMLPQIKRISRDICHAVGDKGLIGTGKGIAFQIYGLDFLVDQHGKPWLCQVNNNPSLEICCSLLSRIIPELIENTFRLIHDVLLPSNKKIPDYAQNFILNNRYALLYSNQKRKKNSQS